MLVVTRIEKIIIGVLLDIAFAFGTLKTSTLGGCLQGDEKHYWL
jgi:hypothetical protein